MNTSERVGAPRRETDNFTIRPAVKQAPNSGISVMRRLFVGRAINLLVQRVGERGFQSPETTRQAVDGALLIVQDSTQVFDESL